MKNYFLLFILLIINFLPSYCQTGPSLTEPKLTSVNPINSTAITITWQFADQSIDQSNFIQISIVINELYYTYSRTYDSINYTFASTNKTITSLIRNFELVNAYYYVCFSSNSTVTNSSVFLYIANKCILARTCLRSNTACPGPSNVTISSTSISSNSFTIAFFLPTDLPYSWNTFYTQLINNGQIGTSSGITQNTSYMIRSYQFTGLQSRTTYIVNTSYSYSIVNMSPITNIISLAVTTSSLSKFSYTSDLFSFCLLLSVRLFL